MCAFIKVKESYDKVASEDVGRLSIVQDVLRKNIDFLSGIIALASGVGCVILSYVCPHSSGFPLEDYPTGYWECNSAPMPMQRRKDCAKKMINWLKLLTNQQRDGDSSVESIDTGLREKRRKSITDGLRKFIEVDNHGAVNVGGLR